MSSRVTAVAAGTLLLLAVGEGAAQSGTAHGKWAQTATPAPQDSATQESSAKQENSPSGEAKKPAEAPVAPAALGLTASQRHVLFTSISSRTHKSTAAPPTFLPELGAVVPPSVEVLPIPDAALELMPKLRGYVSALVANQALIIDSKSRQIVEIISEHTTPQTPPPS